MPALAGGAGAPLRSHAVAQHQHRRPGVGGPAPGQPPGVIQVGEPDLPEGAGLPQQGAQFDGERLPDGHRRTTVQHQVQVEPAFGAGPQHRQPADRARSAQRLGQPVGGRGLVQQGSFGVGHLAFQRAQRPLQGQRAGQDRRAGGGHGGGRDAVGRVVGGQVQRGARVAGAPAGTAAAGGQPEQLGELDRARLGAAELGEQLAEPVDGCGRGALGRIVRRHRRPGPG